MSNASEARHACTLEASFATLPVGATPKLHEMTFVSSALQRQTQTTASARIVTGAQIASRKRIGLGGGGSVPDELSYGGMVVQVVSSLITGTSPATIGGATNAFTNISVGDWVRFYRPGSANNGYWFVTAKGGSNDTLTVVGEHGATITTESAGSEAEIAVDSEYDMRWLSVLRAPVWTKAIDVGCVSYFAVSAAGKLQRAAISLSETGVFAIIGNKLNRSSGDWTAAPIKIGMKILIAGFATAANNGLKTVVTVTATDIGFADNLVNEATPGGAVTVNANFVTDGFIPGMLVKVSGFATASNNDIFRVTDVATTLMTLSVAMTTESAPAGQVRIKGGSYILNDTNQHTFFIEREQADAAAGLFQRALGMQVGAVNVGVTRGIGTTNWTYVGSDVQHGFSVTAGTGTDHASSTNEVFNGVENVRRVRIDDVAMGTFPTAFDVTIANNAAPREGLGSLGAVSLRNGQMDATINVTAYYEDDTLPMLNQDFDDVKVSVIFDGSQGEALALDVLAANVLSAPVTTPGNNQDCTVQASFGAKRDATLLKTVRVTRWPN